MLLLIALLRCCALVLVARFAASHFGHIDTASFLGLLFVLVLLSVQFREPVLERDVPGREVSCTCTCKGGVNVWVSLGSGHWPQRRRIGAQQALSTYAAESVAVGLKKSTCLRVSLPRHEVGKAPKI